MTKKLTFCLILFSIFSLFSESYLTNVEPDPEHGHLNYDGSLKFFYDLPKPDLVKKAYLQAEIGGLTSLFDSTVTDSGFIAIDNSLQLSGEELYKVIKSSESLADGDKSLADGTYSIKVRIELDTSSNDNDEENDDDEENNDDDSDSETVPGYAEKIVKVVFDNKPPQTPAAIEVEGGNKQMLVRVTPPNAEDSESKEKIGKYHAKVSGVFKNGDAETETVLEYSSSVDSDSYDKTWEFKVSGKDGYEFINNDEGKTSKNYTIEVYAEDLAGNSDTEAVISVDAAPVTTYGFWSNYAYQNNGKDDGGFCFIATAGFGSYFHPSVALLRNFRDSVLSKFDLGRKFIATYYKYGVYPAEIIKDSPLLRAASRTFLMPLVVLAWFLTTFLGRILMISWLFSIAFFALKSNRKLLLVAFFLLVAVLPAQKLAAKGFHGEASFTNLLYYPANIDSSSDGTPFKDNFGTGIRYLPSLTFGLAIPTEYIRISFVGGIGYTRFKGRAVRSDGSKSADRTTMHFIPLKAEIKLRPVYNFPLYPFIAGGIDYYTWWVRDHGSTSENGGTFGLHGTVGLMLSLNWMDPSSSKKMKENGVFNTCLFLGYKFEKINDFWRDKSFDLSNRMKYNFEFGLVFEF